MFQEVFIVPCEEHYPEDGKGLIISQAPIAPFKHILLNKLQILLIYSSFFPSESINLDY